MHSKSIILKCARVYTIPIVRAVEIVSRVATQTHTRNRALFQSLHIMRVLHAYAITSRTLFAYIARPAGVVVRACEDLVFS